MKYRVKGHYIYQAWPETAHAARSMRKIARETRVGHNHALTAAIVMTAFAVEAFCQALGPDVFGDDWFVGKPPRERLPVKVKLKCIGKRFGVQVNYGSRPWKDVAALLGARDELAHPKPEVRVSKFVVEAVDGDAARQKYQDGVFRAFHPLHDIDELDRVAAEVEEGLLCIWEASGGRPHMLDSWSMGTWSISAIESE